jgi:hypothetical protein
MRREQQKVVGEGGKGVGDNSKDGVECNKGGRGVKGRIRAVK